MAAGREPLEDDKGIGIGQDEDDDEHHQHHEVALDQVLHDQHKVDLHAVQCSATVNSQPGTLPSTVTVAVAVAVKPTNPMLSGKLEP